MTIFSDEQHVAAMKSLLTDSI